MSKGPVNVAVASVGHAGFFHCEDFVQIQMVRFPSGGAGRLPAVWLKGPQSGGLGGRASRDGSLKTPLGFRVKGHGRLDLLMLSHAPQEAETSTRIRMNVRLRVCVQGVTKDLYGLWGSCRFLPL